MSKSKISKMPECSIYYQYNNLHKLIILRKSLKNRGYNKKYISVRNVILHKLYL